MVFANTGEKHRVPYSVFSVRSFIISVKIERCRIFNIVMLDHVISQNNLVLRHGRDPEDTFLLVIKGSLITPAMFILQSCIILNGVVDTAGRYTY